MKLYTKGGDDGTTGLFGGARVPKNHDRVIAYGEVDELNAALGVAMTQAHDETLVVRLRQIQSDLFVVGGELAAAAGQAALVSVGATHAEALEPWIDEACSAVPPLRNFILPGGTPLAAHLHLARAVCRRAERAVVALTQREAVNLNIVVYLNRLGDLLFAWAREANHRAGVADIDWHRPP
jgi:cob(I)alamin adenosyltransferase